MHPPQYVLDEIEKLHPHARLGWVGDDKSLEENAGGFYFVQLIKKKLVDFEFNEPWLGQGPLYGSDYDPVARIPYKMAGPFHPKETAWSEILQALKVTLTPINDRIYKTNRSKGEAYDDRVKDLAGEMGSKLYWESKQTGAASRKDLAYKDLTEEEKAVLRGERMKDLRGTFTQGM